MSATILSFSAYLTIIAANFDKMMVSLNIAPYDLITVLSMPFFSWTLCLIISMKIHVEPPQDAVLLLDINLNKWYIAAIYKYKHFCLLVSYIFLFLPFLYLATSIITIYDKITDLNFLVRLFAFIITATFLLSIIALSHFQSWIPTKPLPAPEPEMIIKADEAGAYYEYK